MNKIAFATFSEIPQGIPDDALAAEALARFGKRVSTTVWDAPQVNWSRFDAVVIRSTWDYHLRQEAFEAWLTKLESLGVHVINPPETIRWNWKKTYLTELEQKGIPILPTEWIFPDESADVCAILRSRGWEKAVVKPVTSLDAHNTLLVSCDDPVRDQQTFAELLAEGALMVQQYMETISTTGEWGLMYFDGTFSHAALKKPSPGDFRVQERFGGKAEPAEAPNDLIMQTDRILEQVAYPWSFARVDGVLVDDQFLLMELELIEPTLFFSFDEQSAEAFAKAIVKTIDQEAVVGP